MKLKETIEEIDEGRKEAESGLVFCFYNNPELIDDYEGVDKEGNLIFHNEDAIFYYNVAKAMKNEGYKTIDALACETYFADKPNLRERFDGYGGYSTIAQLKGLANKDNADAYYDQIIRRNMLTKYAEEYFKIFSDVKRFASSSSEDVYNTFELINNKVSLEEGHREDIVPLNVTKDYFQACIDGDEVGLSFEQPKISKALNAAMMGLYSPGVHLLAGLSGKGKSSFAFEVIVLGLVKNGYHVGIIANEMTINRFQGLLTAHILREDLHNFSITRSKVSKGVYTDEEKDILMNQVTKISEEKYGPYIHFVKMYDNKINQVVKQMRRMRNQYGIDAILYDTYKSDDDGQGGKMWEELLQSTRRLFREADKLHLAVLCTYQLAPHTVNQRYLDVSALSNSKGIKAELESLLMIRSLFSDEYNDMKNDVKPYKLVKPEGSNSWIKEKIELDPNEKYYIVFLDKTRSNESDVCLLFEAKLHVNEWREIGRCTPVRDYKTY